MDIFKIAVIALSGTFLAAILKEEKKEYALYAALATVIVIFISILSQLTSMVEFLYGLKESVSGGAFYIPIIIKILGVAYIADFTAQICKDSGETAIGSKVELAGKVMIFYLAIPVITSIMELIDNLIPQ